MSVKKEITNFFQESFFTEPSSSIDKTLFFKNSFSTNLVRIIFKYFSSETGRAKTYKRIIPYQLAQEIADKYFFKVGKIPDKKDLKKEIKKQDSLIRRAINEISTSDIFLVSDCKEKGVLFFYPTEANKKLFSEAKKNKLKVDIDIQEIEKIILTDGNKIVNFPTKRDFSHTGNDSTHTRNDFSHTGNDSTHTRNETKSKMINWSIFEADLEKVQEAYIKEAYIKNHSIQEKELNDISNVKVETSKMNEVNDDKNKLINKNTEDKAKVETLSEDLLKQKAMTETFIKNVQKESSARVVPPVLVGPAGEKSQDVIELEDKLHSLGVKEEVYLKALGCHGYEKVKSIYEDMYKCLSFQKLNDLEPIRNKGLYLSQRFEKLDNPEIKLSFICNAYEESKVSNQVIVNDNEPKIYQNKELMNKVLNAISIKTFLSFKTSNNYYKAVEIIKSIFGSYEISIKKPDTEEQRKSLEFAHEMAQKFNPNIGRLLTYEEKQAENITFIKRFKSNFDVNELKLLIDLFKKFSSYMPYQKELLNDFIVWFEGV